MKILNAGHNINNYNTITDITSTGINQGTLKYENINFNTEENVKYKPCINYTYKNGSENTYNKNNTDSNNKNLNKPTENKLFTINIEKISSENKYINNIKTNRSRISTDFNNNQIVNENNKDNSFLSSNIITNDNDKNKFIKFENNTENTIKKTKSMTKLATSNNDKENLIIEKNKESKHFIYL
jgi:hypothetical protein